MGSVLVEKPHVRNAVRSLLSTTGIPSSGMKCGRIITVVQYYGSSVKMHCNLTVDRMIGIYTGPRSYHYDGLDVLPVGEFLRQLHQDRVF